MSWTERILLAFPVDLFSTPETTLAQINDLAYIVDPDSGGRDTFSADRVLNDYFVAESQFKETFIAFLGADVATWQAVLVELAQAKNVAPLSAEMIATLHDGLKFGDAAKDAVLRGYNE